MTVAKNYTIRTEDNEYKKCMVNLLNNMKAFCKNTEDLIGKSKENEYMLRNIANFMSNIVFTDKYINVMTDNGQN